MLDLAIAGRSLVADELQEMSDQRSDKKQKKFNCLELRNNRWEDVPKHDTSCIQQDLDRWRRRVALAENAWAYVLALSEDTPPATMLDGQIAATNAFRFYSDRLVKKVSVQMRQENSLRSRNPSMLEILAAASLNKETGEFFMAMDTYSVVMLKVAVNAKLEAPFDKEVACTHERLKQSLRLFQEKIDKRLLDCRESASQCDDFRLQYVGWDSSYAAIAGHLQAAERAMTDLPDDVKCSPNDAWAIVSL